MSTIAFIGLGIMGGPMAAHLVSAGHTVLGVNRSPAPVQRLVEAGGKDGGSVAGASAQADVVITMVPDSPDVESVALGDDGIYANARPGTVHLDMSTIRPDVASRLAEAGAAREITVLDAPVSGGEAGAKEAKLSIMVGGDEATFAAVKPVLDVLGPTVVLVGPAGSGQTVKAANQLIVAGHYQLLAEAIVFLRAYGVDTEAALQVLGGRRRDTMRRPQGGEHARRSVRAGVPDRPCTTRTWASSRRRPASAGWRCRSRAARPARRGAAGAGDGGLDHSALLRGVERLSGSDVSGPELSGTPVSEEEVSGK